MNERHKHKRVKAVARLKPVQSSLPFIGWANTVYFRRLEREEFAILRSCATANRLNAAIDAGLRQSATPATERPLLIQKWFQTWSTLGWFCP